MQLTPLSQREVWARVSLSAEDIYLFGTMITGFLLIGAGLALAYQRIKEAEPAVQTPTRLPAGIETMGRGVSSQNGLIECSTDKILEKLTAAVNTQIKTSECKLDYILEKLTAVVSSQNDNITECKSDNIIGSSLLSNGRLRDSVGLLEQL